MAEHPLVQAQDVIRCNYCETEVAVLYCKPCNDELCNNCKTFHLKSKVPTGHDIVTILTKDKTGPDKACRIHPPNRYSLYCRDCLIPVCNMCIEGSHKKHECVYLNKICNEERNRLQSKASDMRTYLLPKIKEMLQNVKTSKSDLVQNQNNLTESMRKQADKLKQQIDSVLQEICDEAKKETERNLNELTSYEHNIHSFQERVNKLLVNIDKQITESHPVDFIFYLRENQKELHIQDETPETISLCKASFTAKQIDKSVIKKELGKLTPGTLTKTRTVLTLSDLNSPVTELENNVHPTLIKVTEYISDSSGFYCMVACDTNTAYVSGSTCNVWLLDLNGAKLDTLRADCQPYGLTLMPDGTILYLDYNCNRILRISRDKNRDVFALTKNPRGMCCTRSGDVLVCTTFPDAKVVRFSNDGKIKQTIREADKKELYAYPHFICENINSDVIVSDSDKRAVIAVNNEGVPRYIYEGMQTKSFMPSGLAADSHGNIVIADTENSIIHLINLDGEFKCHLLTSADGIERPWVLFVDHRHKLWIIEKQGSTISTYQLHYSQ